MSKADGGAAFPSKFEIQGPNFDPVKQRNVPVGQTEVYIDMGMSIRDYFAAKALSTAAGYAHQDLSTWEFHDFARHAYGIADAMLAERAK